MKMMVILTMTEGADPAAFAPLLVPEEQVLWRSYREGILREWYFQQEPLTVVLIFEVTDSAEAGRQINMLRWLRPGCLTLAS